MPIAFVNAADLGNNGGGDDLTVGYTAGSGANRCLLLGVKGAVATDNITGATYGGVAMTLIDKAVPGSNRWCYLFRLLAAPTGSNNFVIVNSSNEYIIAVAADYTGVDQTNPIDVFDNKRQSDVALNCPLVTTVDNDWMVMVGGGYVSNQPPIAGSGTTRRTFDATFGAIGVFDSNGTISPPGSTSLTFDYGGSASDNNAVFAALRPAGATILPLEILRPVAARLVA